MVGLGHAVLECVKRERKRDQADRLANVVHPQAVENILTVLLRLTWCRRIFIGLGSRVAKRLQRDGSKRLQRAQPQLRINPSISDSAHAIALSIDSPPCVTLAISFVLIACV